MSTAVTMMMLSGRGGGGGKFPGPGWLKALFWGLVVGFVTGCLWKGC